MTARVIAPSWVEAERMDRVDAGRARQAVARERADLETVARFERLAEAWGESIDAEMLIVLAQQGVEPDSPLAQELATAGAKKKSKSGLGWHSIGDVVSAAGRGADKLLGGVDEATARALRPAVRGAAVGAQSLYEEAQGAVRNVASFDVAGIPVGAVVAGAGVAAGLAVSAPVSLTGAAIAGAAAVGGGLGALASQNIEGEGRWELQSSGGIALEQWLRGEDSGSFGDGWLPRTPERVAKLQHERATRVSIGGGSLTPGRLLVGGVVEPGSRPYDALSGVVDMSLALSRFDPASALGKAAGTAHAQSKLLVEAGGINGLRRTVDSTRVAQWLGSEKGREVIDLIAATDSFDELWRATGKKIPVATTLELADARTADEVQQILQPLLGVTLREKPTYSTIRPLENVRLLGGLPGENLDFRDLDQAVDQADRYLRNAGLGRSEEGRARIAEVTEQIARSTNREAFYNATTEMFAAVEDELASAGGSLLRKSVDENTAAQLTRWSLNQYEDTRHYMVDDLGQDVNVPGVVVDGAAEQTAHPFLLVQFLNRPVPLPNVRDIRSATSKYSRLFENGFVKEGTALADFLVGQVWKRAVLLRGAYTVRVVGEEQVRMGASGLTSMIHHPLSHLAWVTGRKGATDVRGEVFAKADDAVRDLDEFNQARYKDWAGWVDDRRIATENKVRIRRGQQGYGEAWADELLTLRADPIASAVARADSSLDDVKQDFWDGPLAFARHEFAEMVPEFGTNRLAADAYIDAVFEAVQRKTRGEGDLLELVAGGRMGLEEGTPFRSKELVAQLNDLDGPEWVIGDQWVHVGRGRASSKLDQATTAAFSWLMGKPSNWLSRQPTFKQMYWQRIDELTPMMSVEARNAAAAQARAAGLDDLAGRWEKATRNGDLDLDDVDLVAKGFALDETRKLLYDMTERGQFFDATRLVFPFGEAWREMVRTYARIGLDAPQTARRAQQVIQGARTEGFFRENAFGEEVFTYPGSEFATEALLGVPVPLTGRVSGLSLMTEVLPGVGPAVSLPVAWLAPDVPDADFIKELIFPFGEPDTDAGIVEAFLPAWMKELTKTGATPFARDERRFFDTVKELQRYLASTGRYDLSKPEGMIQLTEDAKARAPWVHAIGALAKFFAPSSPTPEYLAHDKDGTKVLAWKLTEEYYEILGDKDRFPRESDAVAEFVARHGENVLLLMQGKTREVIPNAPTSKEAASWERSNRGVANRYPNTFGIFAPQGGDYDPQAYRRALDTGRIETLSPEQTLRLANDRLARARYERAKREVGPRPNEAQRRWLAELRDALTEDFPGYGDRVGISQSATPAQMIAELTDAVTDERLADNPVVPEIRTYLRAREQALGEAQARGLSTFATARGATDLRQWLRTLGDALVDENPAFEVVWERVFQREMRDETDEQEEAA